MLGINQVKPTLYTNIVYLYMTVRNIGINIFALAPFICLTLINYLKCLSPLAKSFFLKSRPQIQAKASNKIKFEVILDFYDVIENTIFEVKKELQGALALASV